MKRTALLGELLVYHNYELTKLENWDIRLTKKFGQTGSFVVATIFLGDDSEAIICIDYKGKQHFVRNIRYDCLADDFDFTSMVYTKIREILAEKTN